MKDHSGSFQKLLSSVKSSVSKTPTSKDQELTSGFRAMLPDWVAALREGVTVEDLVNEIKSVKLRYYHRLTGFSKFISGHAGNVEIARQQIDQVGADQNSIPITSFDLRPLTCCLSHPNLFYMS